MTEMASVSVIILTRDRLAKLRRCLDCLEPQLAPGDEVVVIDTGSEDGTLEAFSNQAPPWLVLCPFEGQGSWAEARNFGMQKAGNTWVAFLDDDCYADPDWMDRGRAGLESCDALGGLVEPHAIEQWPEDWSPEMGWLVGLSVPGHLTPDAGRVYYPFTANLWVRADVARAEPFQELGGEFHAREEDRYQTGR